MGEIAEESAYAYRNDDFKEYKGYYLVKLVHRKTMEVFWKQKMNADSPEECQKIFREKYQNIRNQFDNNYALLCERK